MAKVPAENEKVRQEFDELSAFVARQDVVDSLERAAKDKQLLRKAKADPEGFLKSQGHKLPPRTDVTIRQRRAVSGQITICLQVCRQIGRFMVCLQICITVVFQA